MGGGHMYDEYHHKVNIKWNVDNGGPNNGTVSYENMREYHFNVTESNGTLDQMITIVNTPAATVSYTANYLLHHTQRVMLDVGLELLDEEVFVEKPVKEIIFDGYEDPILSAAEKFKTILETLNIPFPEDMDKFAIFYKRNMSSYYDG